MKEELKKEEVAKMREEVERVKNEINKECYLKIINTIVEKKEDVQKIPQAELLVGLGVSLITNVLHIFIKPEATNDEKHKATSAFLSVIKHNAQKHLDSLYLSTKEELEKKATELTGIEPIKDYEYQYLSYEKIKHKRYIQKRGKFFKDVRRVI
jgi:hypothetical protein